MLSEKGGKSVSFTASRIHKQNLKKKLKNVETLLVINPTSSSGSTGKDWENLYIKMKDALGKDPRVVFT
ncbi:MAG: hypothetical protein ACRD8W_32640, partial [Nitrososphaeraceae archaeon]